MLACLQVAIIICFDSKLPTKVKEDKLPKLPFVVKALLAILELVYKKSSVNIKFKLFDLMSPPLSISLSIFGTSIVTVSLTSNWEKSYLL